MLALTHLEHAGVKGMKWGTRRANRAQNLINVGKGKGTTSDKLRAYNDVSVLVGAIKKGSLKKSALSVGEKRSARIDRVQKGKASVTDKIAYYGTTKMQDITPTSKTKQTGKAAGLKNEVFETKTSGKAAIGASVAGAIVVGVGANVALAALRAAS